MTWLAEFAYSEGAKYILPVDADEILIGDLDKMCIKITKGCLRFPWKIYHPTERDDYAEQNPFLRQKYYSSFQRSPGKILIKWEKGMKIRQGNHGLEQPYPGFIEDKESFSSHFSWRSKEHMKNKIINLGKAYENMKEIFNHEPSNNNYEAYKRDGEKFINEYWKQIETNSSRLTYDPLKEDLFR
jgi:hypothetical protein